MARLQVSQREKVVRGHRKDRRSVQDKIKSREMLSDNASSIAFPDNPSCSNVFGNDLYISECDKYCLLKVRKKVWLALAWGRQWMVIGKVSRTTKHAAREACNKYARKKHKRKRDPNWKWRWPIASLDYEAVA